jgi:N-carbamoylputrescine amidase
MPHPEKFVAGLVQMVCASDTGANVSRAADLIRHAAQAGARVVCLPELFRTPYFCQCEDPAAFDLAEPIPGPTSQALAAVARQSGVVVIAPIFERRAPGVYHNSVAVIDADGSVRGVYRKMHIPDDPAYYEKFYFTPGDLGFRAFDTCAGRLAPLICWDQWFPEAARLSALRGASMLFYPTAIGWQPHEMQAVGAAQRDAWRTIQRAHAIANGVYVGVVNRVGHEKPDGAAAGSGIKFWGSSFFADPFGVVLAEAATDREETLLAEIDLARLEDVRRNWPFLRDRRVDAYAGLEQHYLDDEPK